MRRTTVAGEEVAALVQAGVILETTGKKHDRRYSYHRYLERFRVGTEFEILRRTVR